MEYGQPTLDLLAGILDEGVTHVALLMRHSARTYDPDIREVENQLTDEGRELARGLGEALPKRATVRAYNSPVDRCVETAELIVRGHEDAGGKVTRSRQIEALGHFYILDWAKLGKVVEEVGMSGCYRRWFDDEIEPDIMIPSKMMSQLTAQVAAEKLRRPVGGLQVDLLVSHDMNLYPLRQHLLEQPIDEFGPVNYLDALAFYEQDGQAMIRSQHADARPLVLGTI